MVLEFLPFTLFRMFHVENCSLVLFDHACYYFFRTFVERQDDLTDTFGSKIKRKALATRQRNKVSDVTDVVQASVQGFVETEGITGES